MANTYQEADSVANSINTMFGKNDWFLGVGIGKENDEFIVSVRVTKSAVAAIPSSLNGVPIKVVKQDMPVAL